MSFGDALLIGWAVFITFLAVLYVHRQRRRIGRRYLDQLYVQRQGSSTETIEANYTDSLEAAQWRR